MKRCMDYQEGLISLPIYAAASALNDDQVLMWGKDGGTYTTGTQFNVLITADDDGTDAFAVLTKAPTTHVTDYQTPVIYQGKVALVANDKIWRVYYDMAAANDVAVTSYSSPTITCGTSDEDLDGAWIYINTGPGAGELRYAKAAASTSFTVNTAFTTTLTSSSHFVLIRNVGLPIGGHTLDSTFTMMKTILDAGNSKGMIVLKNFMEGAGGSWELDITKNSHCEMDGLSTRGVRFYSDIVFTDTAFGASGL